MHRQVAHLILAFGRLQPLVMNERIFARYLPIPALVPLLAISALSGCGFGTAVVASAISDDASSASPANVAPVIQFRSGVFAGNVDQRLGISLPFQVSDNENGEVAILLQWTFANEPFPDLSGITRGSLPALLDDSARRQALRIGTEVPLVFSGIPRASRSGDPMRLELPELAGSAAHLLGRGEMAGRTLELQRASRIPQGIRSTWEVPTPLSSPVAVVPVDDGLSALVLDSESSGWRVRRIELATGQLMGQEILGAGTPCAMTWGTNSTVLVTAFTDRWILFRLRLTGGPAEPIIQDPLDNPVASGMPVGLLSMGVSSSLMTVGTSLVRIDHPPSGAAIRSVVMNGLASPAGLIADPNRLRNVLLIERGLKRILRIALDTRQRERLPIGALSLADPTSIAYERQTNSLLVMNQGGDLVMVRLGFPVDQGAAVAIPTGLSGIVGPLSTGPDGLRILCLTSSDDLAVAGGLEQQRTILGYEPSSREARVDSPFSPVPSPGTAERLLWKISDTAGLIKASKVGSAHEFLWDSDDVPRTGLVFVRLLAFDSAGGSSQSAVAALNILDAYDPEQLCLGLGGCRSGTFPYCLTRDVDSSGTLDIVSANDGNGEISYRRAIDEPDLTVAQFDQVRTLTDGLSSRLADMNDDGLLDVVAFDGRSGSTSDKIRVHLQEAGGTFSPSDDLMDSGVISAVELADVDSDGRLDVVAANRTANHLAFFPQVDPNVYGGPIHIGAAGATIAPVSVAVADLNGDGRQDLVAANSAGSTANPNGDLAVFLQSAGGFTPQPDFVLGGGGTTDGPSAVRVVDLDYDGLLDIVSSNEEGGTVSAFFQSSQRGFPESPSFIIEQDVFSPSDVIAADVDSNGTAELIVINRGASQAEEEVRLIFRQLDDTLVSGPDIILDDRNSLNEGPTGCDVEDLDGDGRPDLAVAYQGGAFPDGTVAIYPRIGPGRFVAAGGVEIGRNTFRVDFMDSTNPAFHSPDEMDVVDLDQDGDLDFVSANKGGETITGFRQLEHGGFESVPSIALGAEFTSPGVGNQPVPPVSAGVLGLDLDGDGLVDLASTDLGRDRIVGYLQDAAEGFGEVGAQTFPDVDLPVPGAVDIAAGDFNLDGAIDLVGLRDGDGAAVIFHQTSSTPLTFSLVDHPPLRSTALARRIEVVDIDQDGLQDVVSSAVFFQAAPGSFRSELPDLTFDQSGFAASLAQVADMNDDGFLDLVAADGGPSGQVRLYFQAGRRSFGLTSGSALTPNTSVSICCASGLQAGDIDSDGDTDFVVSVANPFILQVGLAVVVQVAPGQFLSRPQKLGEATVLGPTISFLWPGPPRIVDLDGDGDKDIVAAFAETPNAGLFGSEEVSANYLRAFFGSH